MQLWLIPTLPLIGFLINGIFGRRLSKTVINIVAVGSVLLSLAWVVKVLLGINLDQSNSEYYFTWIQSGDFKIDFAYQVDRLTAIWLLVVTGIGSLIHIYATGYMAHEEGYYRFFAYLNLFMFFMLNLVLAANYLLLFVGWEGVGLCSYLLIGFYFTKKFATDAGNKAFIVNRIGDFGFSLAMFLIAVNFGSLDFGAVFSKIAPHAEGGILTTIGLLLLVGAAGKSAQIPLYVWLPDAMAGPTPVSALIHAATMVTAGVYMVCRSFPIYTHAPEALHVIALIGLATAFFAATIGMTQFDIKKVYAYSTVSQLGYMFLAVGCGAFSAGVFHVVTHAFFKALLFLGAGSVIHAVHGEQDMRHMGGLRKYAPVTYWTMLCATLAISGFPFTSGFFSKDSILLAAHHHSPWMYWVGVLTAGITAFYCGRAFIMTFFGEYRGHGHPHESPWSMTGPLVVLAILSLAGGYLAPIPEFLGKFFPTMEEAHDIMLVVIGSSAGIIGLLLAGLFYYWRPGLADSIASSLGGLYKLVYNKYFVDEAYDAAVVRPMIGGSRLVLWRGIDAGLIDGIVNGVGKRARNVGSLLRQMQSGNIRSYATWVVFGSVLVIVALGLARGVK